MTEEQFREKLLSKIRSLKIAEQIVYPAATVANASMLERLFEKGIGGDGAKVGSYSTEPMYASKKQFRNTGAFKAQGKTGKKKEGRKSMYLAGGYKQLRQVQGYESSYVNLFYYGDLYGEMNKLTVEKDTVVVRLSREINKKKVDGLREKYGKETFQHTKKEKEQFAKDVSKMLANYFSN